MLFLIWLTALLLGAGALLVMLALIGARVVNNMLTRRREAARARMLEALLAWLDGQGQDEAVVALLDRHRGIGRRLLVEIFELMRGADQTRLATLAAEAGVPQHLRRRLATGGRHQRLSAAESLVWFQGPETREALTAALEDADDDVALAAAASLAELGEILPIERLLRARLGHRGESSRRLEAVLTSVAPRQVDDLAALAVETKAPERVRAAAVDALARTSASAFLVLMERLWGDPAPVVRSAIARGLGVLGHPEGATVILRLLDDPHWEVRAEAAEAAGRIGLIDAAERLAALLQDETWWVRFRAGEALAALGDHGIVTLKRLAASSDEVARRMSSLVLAEKGLAA